MDVVFLHWSEDMKDTKIRMIFCDVDGTLLPRDKTEISSDVFDAINHTLSSGLHFVVASGRSYPDLKKLFSPVANKLIFICNDGANVIDKENTIFSSPLNKSQVTCMAKTFKGEYEALVLYSKDYTYYVSEKLFSDFGTKICNLNEITELSGNIFKVAFYKFSEKGKIKLNNLGIKSGILNNVYTDNLWTEYVNFNTDKGTAVEEIQKKYAISHFESAAFGDNLNDLGMLRRARMSFSVPYSNPEVVKMCKYKTNNVIKEILNIIEKGDQYE